MTHAFISCSLKRASEFRFPLVGYILKQDNMTLQVILAEEKFYGISNLSFAVRLARPSLVFVPDAIVSLYAGAFLGL